MVAGRSLAARPRGGIRPGSPEFRPLASPWKPQKRRRGTWSSNDETSVLRYKLIHLCVIRLEDTDLVRLIGHQLVAKNRGLIIGAPCVLFEKAQQFYKGMEKRTGLLCTVYGVEGVRYVGERTWSDSSDISL
jgi:hypothetical protein